jgi:hypothetical protein
MDIIYDLNLQLARHMNAYLSDIALAIVATCLVVYGSNLNNFIKRIVSSWMLIFRIIAFILMCTFGYGLLTVWLQPILKILLKNIAITYLPISVFAIFCLLGVLAERKRHL